MPRLIIILSKWVDKRNQGRMEGESKRGQYRWDSTDSTVGVDDVPPMMHTLQRRGFTSVKQLLKCSLKKSKLKVSIAEFHREKLISC